MRTLALGLLLALGSLTAACGDPNASHLGQACTSNSDCTSAQTCETTAPGGYCTQSCTTLGSTSECPANGICDDVSFNGTTRRVCTLICQNQSDCRTGYQCNGTSSGSSKSCRPS